MTNPTPTSGAADLPEALHRVIDAFERRERGIPQAHIAAALVTELRAALTAQAISVEPAGACAAELRRLHAELETLPVGYINRGIAPHTKGKTVFHEKPTTNLEARWWSRDEPVFLASHGQAPAQTADFTTLGAAMRAIQQAIGLIGAPTDERMRAVRRVLRGAVIVAEVGSMVEQAISAEQAGAPAATVIKRGADREWMSERLGHLPDGVYSLYLAAPQPSPSPAPAQPVHVQNSPENEHVADDVSKSERESNMTAQPGQEGELLQLAKAYKEYIDALPADVVAALPAMPGVDGDWASEVLDRATRAAPQPATADSVLEDAAQWFTVVYHGISTADEARSLGEHPKAAAISWSHAIRERDAARSAQKEGEKP